jgi:hypothetical protein
LVIVEGNSKVLLIVTGCQKIRLIKGYFMNMFVAWRDSLSLFQPKNLKLFLLVTLKAMMDALKVWIKYFFWLPFIGPVLNFVLPRLVRESDLMIIAPILSILVALLWLVSVLLAARPSVAIKNCAYFRSYIWRMIYVLPIYLLVMYGRVLFQGLFVGIAPVLSVAVLGAVFATALVNYFASVYLVNYALFVLDSDGSIMQSVRSLLYAAKMTLYSYPFYFIFYFLVSLIKLGVSSVFYPIMAWYYSYFAIESVEAAQESIGLIAMHYTHTLLLALVTLFTYCFLTNAYVKKLHDQFTLYYGKNA